MLLESLFWHEDPGSDALCSQNCEHSGPFVHCLDCDSPLLLCHSCAVKKHHDIPLHRIRRWNGTHYESDSLARLGLTFYLGHQGNPCPERHQNFVAQIIHVMDLNGLHNVQIEWCRCPNSASHASQLFQVAWMPATLSRPGTAFTFRVMKHFQMLSYVGRVTPWSFCTVIQRLTDNVQTELLPVSFILCSFLN